MFELRGVNEFAELARAARLASAELPKEMRKGIAKVGPPARKAIRISAGKKMPKTGGYAATLAKAIRVSVKTDTGFTTASVTIKTHAAGRKRRRDIPAINQGRLRHPVYGHRKRRWVTQRVRPGFWDDAIDEVFDDANRRFVAVLDATIDKLKG